MLKGKNIIVGITGSIAAYKAAILIRLLVKKGANVKVVMTPLAKEFITPLTLATLAKNPVLVEFYNPENGDWNSHVDLGLWADVMLIAPASANTMAKMANGIADNLLLTTYLSIRKKVIIAPAMDLDMYAHAATQRNVSRLMEDGADILEASTGDLASGLSGKGRMQEPENIVDYLEYYLALQQYPNLNKFKNKMILVTAGPTHEPVDPVRFIGNHSSGKMGYAIANQLAFAGANVSLVSGPVGIPLPDPRINRIKVETADQMFQKVQEFNNRYDIAILTAAVADYKPSSPATHKIKSKQGARVIELSENPDISAYLGEHKTGNQLLAGFALETENELQNAKAKLKAKNFDLIVLNSLNEQGAGFKTETNKVTIIDKHNNIENYELKNKKEVALDILKRIAQLIPEE
jgi:phosphopantothenoylcysteine decarboxylase/phosphopantothenate--cysteine ligase